MKKRRWIGLVLLFTLLTGLYLAGPQPEAPQYNPDFPAVPDTPAGLEAFVREREAPHKIKPDNAARIIWSDSAHRRTEYSIVYLHGFSASQKEGDPVHLRFARRFGANLYLSRISDHGIDTTETLLYFTPDRAWNSAKEALAIGRRLGEKVIIISTSTGGTLALRLAATFPDRVHALINLSPNIAINNPAAFLLNDPWGLYIARLVMGGKYRITGASEDESTYWNSKYRLEAVVELQQLLETSMSERMFRSVTQPTLTLYYYKNEEEQDPQVKVSAMLDMHRQLGTPDDLKVARSIPGAGAHVLGSSLTSKDVDGVYQEMESFAVEKLGMHRPLQIANQDSKGLLP